MSKCIECKSRARRNSHSNLCEICFKQQLKASIHDEEVVLRIDIDHPSNEYF